MRRHVQVQRVRFAAALLAGMLILPALPGTALGGVLTFSASAGLAPIRQFVGDSVGQLYTLTVRNTGNGEGIGAIEIKRPSAFWSVLACPGAPNGWSTDQSIESCRYISGAGTGDDIKPGAPAPFTMLVSTGASLRDQNGLWVVTVSKTQDFTNIADLVSATPVGYGLRTRAFSFQITDAVIADAPVAVGSACPAPNRQADPGSVHTLVLCGRNRTTQTQTLKTRYAGLKGTFIRSHGAFTGGPVAPTANPVVLGSWANVKVTSAAGSDMTVLLRVRSAPKRTSAWKTLGGYATNPVAHTPTVVNDGYTTNEDQGFLVFASGLLNNDSDPDLDTLVISKVNGSSASVGTAITLVSGATLTVNADGSFAYSPPTNFNGSDSFTYNAFDGTSDSNTATVSITVNPVNDAPVADNDGYTTNEDQGFLVFASGLLNNDSDPDLDPIIVSRVNGSSASVGTAITLVSGATLTVNADGSFAYSPPTNFNGSDSFTYTLSDGPLASNTATVSITVNPVNDAPVAVGDSVGTTTTTPINIAAPGVLDNDDDADGNPLNAILVTSPTHASSFNLNLNGSFNYTAVGGYTGGDSFQYKANDGYADSNTVTVSITVKTSGGGGGGGGGGCLIAC